MVPPSAIGKPSVSIVLMTFVVVMVLPSAKIFCHCAMHCALAAGDGCHQRRREAVPENTDPREEAV